MNIREISERIRDHLTQQKAKSATFGGSCKYRGPEGTMCAVGCLINDKNYNEGLEGASVRTPGARRAVERSLGSEISYTEEIVLSYWQQYHDVGEYRDWLQGDENYSPSKKHEKLMNDFEYRIKEEKLNA